jgi:hypothetical protein
VTAISTLIGLRRRTEPFGAQHPQALRDRTLQTFSCEDDAYAGNRAKHLSELKI